MIPVGRHACDRAEAVYSDSSTPIRGTICLPCHQRSTRTVSRKQNIQSRKSNIELGRAGQLSGRGEAVCLSHLRQDGLLQHAAHALRHLPAAAAPSIFRDKNRRFLGKSQAKMVQRPPHLREQHHHDAQHGEAQLRASQRASEPASKRTTTTTTPTTHSRHSSILAPGGAPPRQVCAAQVN
jgi:hypothetical protein